METMRTLVAGSHNKNELIYINADEISRVTSDKEFSGQICRICGAEIELIENGEPFIACNECAFLVCKPCYEYERKEGNQVCPQCRTRYVCIKGSVRVQGDEEEDDVDDLENEFNFKSNERADPPHLAVAPHYNHRHLAHGNIVYASGITPTSRLPSSEIPPLAYGEEDGGTSSETHALIVPHTKDGGKQIRPMPLADMSTSLQPWPMDPSKDLGEYGYGSVAWKESMEERKRKQNDKLQIVRHGGDAAGGNKRDEVDDVDLPKYKPEGKPSELAAVDVFVSTVDPVKEPPLITAHTVLSILAVDYQVDKVTCYVSDDGSAMLTFEALSETSEFARKWVPFYKKYNIEPRAPEWYFSQKVDYLKDKVNPAFVRDRRALKRDYEEFKICINKMVANAHKIPEEGWTFPDETPWLVNNVRNHPGMIQVLLGHDALRDVDGNKLPHLIYVSREKRPRFNHHKKAGAMNSLVRVSAVLSNAPYLLNVDCDHYINFVKPCAS